MVVRKMAVNFDKKPVMLARQLSDERFEHLARRAIAGVPSDPHPRHGFMRGTFQPIQQTVNISREDILRFTDADIDPPGVKSPRDATDPPNLRPKERTPTHYYLEAIIIAGIMAASYVNAAIHILG